MKPTYRITDWDAHFENNRTRILKELRFVILPNKQDGDGYTELLAHVNGAAHFGAWCALVQVASKCKPRGILVRDEGGTKPHDPRSLARQTRLSESVFSEAIPRLVEIGWLEEVGAFDADGRAAAGRGAQPDLLTYTENDSAAENDTDSRSGTNRPEGAAPIRIEQNRTELNRTEEKQNASRSVRERTPTRNPRSSIPENFQPDEATITFAAENFPDIDVEGARAEFVDYWLGTGELKSDWNATFRNRLRFLDSKGMMRKKQQKTSANNERHAYRTDHQQTGSGQLLKFKSVI